MNRSLLTFDDVDKMLDHAEIHFPFTFNYQLALVTSARIRDDVAKEKKLAALWSMIGSFGKRNKGYCTAFATIVAFSLMREIQIFIRAVYYLLNSIARQTSLEIREFTLPGPGPF